MVTGAEGRCYFV